MEVWNKSLGKYPRDFVDMAEIAWEDIELLSEILRVPSILVIYQNYAINKKRPDNYNQAADEWFFFKTWNRSFSLCF